MEQEIYYTNDYININREQLLQNVRDVVQNDRFEHILRVEKTALELAQHHNYHNYEKVSIAALMHDHCKEIESAEMLALAKQFVPSEPLEEGNESIWHSYAAAHLAEDKYGIKDSEILMAISQHTIGDYDMELLSKLIFIADYIEPNRNFKGVDKARELAYNSLNHAVFYKMRKTIKQLVKRNQGIYVNSVSIYNYWLENIKEEL